MEVYKEEVILNDNVVRKLKNTCTFASKRFEISNGSIDIFLKLILLISSRVG